MKVISEPRKCKDSDLVTILLYIRQVKMACNLIETSGNATMWPHSTLTAESFVALHTIRLTSKQNCGKRMIRRHVVKRQVRICSYDQTAKCLLSSCKTDDVAAKTAGKARTLKHHPGQTGVTFATVFKSKALESDGALPKQRTKPTFAEGLDLNDRDNKHTFWKNKANNAPPSSSTASGLTYAVRRSHTLLIKKGYHT